MKLRFTIDQQSKIQEFVKIVECFRTYSDTIVFIAKESSFALTVENSIAKAYIWFDINVKSFFREYLCEGTDPESSRIDTAAVDYDDGIYLKVSYEFFLATLSLNKTSSMLEVRLGKDPHPGLTVNSISNDDDGEEMKASNYLPIVIQPRNTWDQFLLPSGSLGLTTEGKVPHVAIFKKYLDTFKNSKIIKITFRNEMSLTIDSSNETSSHYTIFDDIEVKDYQTNDRYKGLSCGVSIDQKKIYRWVSSLFNTFEKHPSLTCMIAEGRHLKLCFKIRDEISSNFVLPSQYEVDDEDESESELEKTEIGPSDDDSDGD